MSQEPIGVRGLLKQRKLFTHKNYIYFIFYSLHNKPTKGNKFIHIVLN